MDTIDGMRTFVAVANKQSFTGAAKVLGVSTKLTSKYIGQLENKLGAQLFNRTTRSVTLTDVGAAYLKQCMPILQQLDDLEAVVQERQTELVGPIRIAAPTAFGSFELVNLLQSFLTQHPRVSIDLSLSDQRVSIIEDGFDLAIRFGKLNDSNLIARKLTDMRLVVVAAPAYLANYGTPVHPQALSTHNCLILKSAVDPQHWAFQENKQRFLVNVSGSFSANSPRAIATMAANGIGIGYCPFYVAEPFLQDQRLQVLFEDNELQSFSLYGLYPQNRHLTARIRELIDHLSNKLKGVYLAANEKAE